MKAILLAFLLAAALFFACGCAAVAGETGIPTQPAAKKTPLPVPTNTTLPAGEGGEDTPPSPPGV